MSYLDTPRIHFGGKFFTDPSTVNNDPTHYEPSCTKPSPWQEPMGQHRFQFRNCFIKSVVGPDGPDSDDTIIGAPIETTDKPNIGRIVDLDVYQQGVSTLFGVNLRIGVGDAPLITGSMDPATLNGFWFNCVLPTRSWQDGDYVQDSFGGDMNAAGYFQTVLRITPENWPVTSSRILEQLRATTLTANGNILLSLKFVLDGYENTPQNQNFRLGRVVGTIGPVYPNEPLYNAGQRWLQPRGFSKSDPWYWPSFNAAIFKVDKVRKKVVLDLTNSICRQNAGGPPADLGTVTANIVLPGGANIPIGEIDYSSFAYENNAHITELDVTDAQVQMLEKAGLSLEMSKTDIGDPVILNEATGVPVFAVEVRPIRMEGASGTTATTQVYVSQNGRPVPNQQLAVYIESVHGDTPGATVPPTNPGNTPQAEGALTATITPSDLNGYATVTMTVLRDPGQRTPELDGQLYFIIVYDPAPQQTDSLSWLKQAPVQEHLISCLVFSDYPVNKNPEWAEIQAMMGPYMKLYPSMREQIDLTDLHTFTVFSMNPPWSKVYNADPGPLGIDKGGIPYYLTRDITDPRFMPISRDLSPAKILTTLYFIKNLHDAKTTPNT